MDTGKNIASARRLSLAIIALGLSTLYAAWINTESMQTLHRINRFEHILQTKAILSERSWSTLQKVTFSDLKSIDFELRGGLSLFPSSCGKEHKHSCQDEKKQQQYLFGISLEAMQDRLPRVRKIALGELRSEYGYDCEVFVFRGQESESYWIRGIGDSAELTAVQGSLLYYVKVSNHCRFSPNGGNAMEFILADARSVGKGWSVYAEADVIRSFHSVGSYTLLMYSFQLGEESRAQSTDDLSFDVDRFFDQLPSRYRTHFTAAIPTVFVTVPVLGIESRIIGEAYRKTGVLYDISQIEKAMENVFRFENMSPTIAGITTSLDFWVPASPYLLLMLSFFLWYHVKRFVTSDSSVGEPWLLLDANGVVERFFALLWASLMIFSIIATAWAMAIHYGIPLEPNVSMFYFDDVLGSPVTYMTFGAITITYLAIAGFIALLCSVLFIVLSFHKIARSQLALYERGISKINCFTEKMLEISIKRVSLFRRKVSAIAKQK